jgi:hypothetical protein
MYAEVSAGHCREPTTRHLRDRTGERRSLPVPDAGRPELRSGRRRCRYQQRLQEGLGTAGSGELAAHAATAHCCQGVLEARGDRRCRRLIGRLREPVGRAGRGTADGRSDSADLDRVLRLRRQSEPGIRPRSAQHRQGGRDDDLARVAADHLGFAPSSKRTSRRTALRSAFFALAFNARWTSGAGLVRSG